jgi:hypothetical protein
MNRLGRIIAASAAFLASALGLAAGAAHAAVIIVSADIAVSETWTADNEYVLDFPIYVTSGATLTIEPGTVVRGQASDPGLNNPGALIITRGSKIHAAGTATDPIVFTDMIDDNVGSTYGLLATPPYDSLANSLSLTGQWGGLILLGRSYVANNTLAGPDATREFQIEGLTAVGGLGLYGNGGNDDDDSGLLNYISIRYGGFNLSANNEINGLTLGAVGRETDIDYVEVFQNKDDGIEMFGGTVNMKHIISANGGDDGLDYDEGYRGKVQFAVVLQGTPGTDKSDKGGEHDGGNAPDGSQPFSIPTFYNVTSIGLGQKAYTDKIRNTALHFRDAAGGRYYNSAFLDFGGATMLVEGAGTSCTGANTSTQKATTDYVPDGVLYRAPDSDFQLELQDNTFYCFGYDANQPGGRCSVTTAQLCCATADCPGGETCVDNAPTYGGDTGKVHYSQFNVFTNAALDNAYIPCADPLPIRALVREDNGLATIPDPITSLDPRPTPAGPLTLTNRVPPNDGFFMPAPYRGAFSPTENWAAGWTTLARVGYFPPVPQVLISNDITTTQTWTADNDYVLDKPIYVSSGATLTIEAGTVVRGQPSEPGLNNPGTLIITRGSKLQALGTPDRPIVFTDLLDDNVRNMPGTAPYDNLENAQALTGQWGGLILLGRSYVANNTLAAPDPAREFQIEGLTAVGGLGLYGGSGLDDDDSGSLSYISIRYGGFNLSANNEINGLTLGAVGRQTRVDDIEVIQNKDDGVEMFGGTVNVKSIMLVNGGDDGVDYDEGYRGKIQFAMVLQGTPGADKSDKGGEHDGGNSPDGSQPFSIPTIYNATYIGQGSKPTYTDKLRNTALHFRDAAGGRYYNSLFADWGGAALLVEGAGTSCTGANTSTQKATTDYVPDGVFYRTPDSAFQLELQDNTFYCAGYDANIPGGRCSVTTTQLCCATADCPVGETCVDNAPTYGGDTGKIHYSQFDLFTNPLLDNVYVPCTDPLPIRALARGIAGSATLPDPIIEIDPRPATGSVLAGGPGPESIPGGAMSTDRSAPNDGFFSPAPYRGAFGPGQNWAQGWSTMSRLDFFPGCAHGAALAPDEVQNLSVTLDGIFSWDRVRGAGAVKYDLLRTDVRNGFDSAGTCVEIDGMDTTAVDANPPVGTIWYYSVRGGNCGGEGPLGYVTGGSERPGRTCP